MEFTDRIQAAHKLAKELEGQKGKHPLVLAVPRGAVPMAKIISDHLGGELDVILVHKFGFPGNPEFALGSVSEDGAIYLGIGAERYGLNEDDVEGSAMTEIKKLQAKRRLYTPHRSHKPVSGRLVIVVDDGIATGATMTAAVRSLQDQGASRIIVATPVAAGEAARRLHNEGAEVCILKIPEEFLSVGQFYEDFSQVSDSEVIRILKEDRGTSSQASVFSNREVTILQGQDRLKAFLSIPENPKGIVLFAHGSGSGRYSPRNQFVARVLYEAGLATLVTDLLMEEETSDRRNVFDIELLAHRLMLCTEWLVQDDNLSKLPVGYFGASTGAGAALQAAAQMKMKVRAVVSRGGRPDLTGPLITEVEAPTLLIVGGEDDPVIGMNESAFDKLRSKKEIKIIPGAGHLFEEPGTLEEVAVLAKKWFLRFLSEKALSERMSEKKERSAIEREQPV